MKLSITSLFLLYCVSLLGQAEMTSRIYQNDTYYFVNGNWCLFDESNHTFIELSTSQVSVKFLDNITATQLQGFSEENNMTLLRQALTGWTDFSFTPPSDILDFCDALLLDPLVENVEVTAPLEFFLTPNDSAYQDIYTNTLYQWSLPQVGITSAWNITTGDPDIVIGFIDSGVDWGETDFAQATGVGTGTFWVNNGEDAWTDPNDPSTGNGIDDDGNGYIDDWRGWDFAFNDNDPSDSQTPHGTPVLSIAGARTNNFEGMAGVAGGWGVNDGVQCMILKVGDLNISSPNQNFAVMDDAILYAASSGADVINISMGSSVNHASVEAAIDMAYDTYNCVIVASSGNNFNNVAPVKFPARLPKVLGVSNTNINNRVQQSHIGEDLDLGAPGTNLPILNPGSRRPPYTEYINQTGTSLSAPLVSGVAGLMYSINPCIDNIEVYNILRYRADTVHAVQNPSSSYYYHWDITRPWHSKALGYGLVDAYSSVNTAKKMKSQTLDLYIKDRFDDFGYSGSYPNNVRFDEGPDIWVRNNPDGFVNQIDEQLEYTTASPAYVYVRVHNKSCVSSMQNETLNVYWTKASTNSSWPQNWDGSNPSVGDLIDSHNIPLLGPGEEVILEFEWTITPTNGVADWGTCILAMINSPQEPNPPMNDLSTAIKSSNNLAIKNLRVENIYPGKARPIINDLEYPHGMFMYVGNDQHRNEPVDIHFDVPATVGLQSLVDAAEIQIYVDNDLWAKIQNLPAENIVGLEIVEEKKLLVTSDHAYLLNVPFGYSERSQIYVGFSFLTEEMQEKNSFKYYVQAFDDEDEITGAMTFIVNRGERDQFLADAGEDESINLGSSVTLSPELINEPATYNWYDSNDSLIYSGVSPTLTPEYTQEYKLEIIADSDGFKDYDEVSIMVNPYFIEEIFPNPASSIATITYSANDASSAYLMIYSSASGNGFNNYILNTSVEDIDIDVSNYGPGIYTVVLVCDGEISDAQQMSIQ